MTKSELIKAFGTQKAIGELIERSKGLISQWPEDLPQDVIDRVVGAAVRKNELKKIQHLLKKRMAP